MALFIKNIYDFKNSLGWQAFSYDVLCSFEENFEEEFQSNLESIFIDLAMIEQGDSYIVKTYLESIKENIDFFRGHSLGFLFVLEKVNTPAGLLNIGRYFLTTDHSYLSFGEDYEDKPIHKSSILCKRGESLLLSCIKTKEPMRSWLSKKEVNLSFEGTANFCLDCELNN